MNEQIQSVVFLVLSKLRPTTVLLGWEDCKDAFLTAKDAKSAKEMLVMDIFLRFFLGALGVLGGSLYPKATLQFPCLLGISTHHFGK